MTHVSARWWLFGTPHFGIALLGRVIAVWLALRPLVAALTLAMTAVLRVSPV